MYNKTVQTIINAHGPTVISTDLELPLKALRGTDGEELRELWKETENFSPPPPPKKKKKKKKKKKACSEKQYQMK